MPEVRMDSHLARLRLRALRSLPQRRCSSTPRSTRRVRGRPGNHQGDGGIRKLITLAIVTLVLFLIAALASAEKPSGSRTDPTSADDVGSGAGTVAGSRQPVTLDPSADYYKRLAAKRLRLLSAREHRIVRLLEVVHKLRGSSGGGGIAHLAGWLCIHNGAYPGAPHEGRGRNGPYSGVLQMTSPWMGNYAPNGSWDNLSDNAVYALAEREFRGTGYSRSWLAGQWPSTYPPCAARF